MFCNRLRRFVRLVCLSFIAFGGAASVVTALPDLRVSSDGRQLVEEDGTPFFFLGDTAWELFDRMTREETLEYLEIRRRQGFTVIQAVGLTEFDGLSSGNRYGHPPLINGDPTRPNPAYWDHVAWVMDRAAEKGIYIGLLPTWGAYVNDHGRRIFNSSNAEVFGKWVGQRFRDKKVIWILGGDRSGNAYQSVYRAMARGIAIGVSGKEDYSKVLMTFHPVHHRISSEWFHQDAWLDFNMSQSGHTDRNNAESHTLVEEGWSLSPNKPMMDAEPRYEDHPVGWDPSRGYFDDFDVRQAAYWSVFAGSLGHTYGNHNIWQFASSRYAPVFHARKSWREAVEMKGAWDMKILKDLVMSRDPLSRRPDQGLIVSGQSGGGAHLRAIRGNGYAYLYTPYGKSFTIRMDRIGSGTLKASWLNPRDGSTQIIGEFSASGTRSFNPPGGEGRGHDWVLVLVNRSANFSDGSSSGGNSGGSGGNAVTPEAGSGSGSAGDGSSSAASGSFNLARYSNLGGSTLSELYAASKFPDAPDSQTEITSLQYQENGDSCGLFAWGWITPPKTGDYTFWLASDDQGELLLSTDASADRAERIAYVSSYTRPEKFDRFSSQKSTTLRLEAGQSYYLAIAVKQGWGSGHFTVAWEGPGFSRRIVKGASLHPDSNASSSSSGGPAVVEESSSVTPAGGYEMGKMAIARYNFIGGSRLADLAFAPKYPANPDEVVYPGRFEYGSGGSLDDYNYGLHAWGWIIPKVSGTYRFWIASDDEGVLRLSSNSDPAKAAEIASISTYCNPNQYDKRASQRSAEVQLQAGVPYYLEAVSKQGWGGANLSVAWEGPGFTRRVIPGDVLALPADGSAHP
jgi:hypothetical protein